MSVVQNCHQFSQLLLFSAKQTKTLFNNTDFTAAAITVTLIIIVCKSV